MNLLQVIVGCDYDDQVDRYLSVLYTNVVKKVNH